MSSLKGKKIILGITGSIAAYKAASLVRLLVVAGAEVKVLMTPAATDFITPLTLSTLAKNSVITDISSEGSWNDHVALGLWADVMLIAPLTATTLAKLASGLSDNIIVATYLSARCPVFFAPAMDVDMWHHPATKQNVATLQAYGNHLIEVKYGELASGLVGEGRMAEPEEMVALLATHFDRSQSLSGKQFLITAGPTYEAIDPVRFIGNRASGKMGIALAEAAAARGAKVHLILGPTHLSTAHPNIKTVRVESAKDMYQHAVQYFPEVDVAIMSAAVGDYRPAQYAEQKVKKTGGPLQIDLVENPDIAASLGRQKQPNQYLIGFALETHEGEKHARAKLKKKNLDFIVLNSLQDEGAGFQVDTNRITLIYPNQPARAFKLKLKTAVAEDIMTAVMELWAEK